MGYNEKDFAELKRQIKAWARSYQAESLRACVEYCGERFYFGREVFDAIKKSDWPDEKKTRYTNALKLLNAGLPYEEIVDVLNGVIQNEQLEETKAADTPCVDALRRRPTPTNNSKRRSLSCTRNIAARAIAASVRLSNTATAIAMRFTRTAPAVMKSCVAKRF